MRKRFVTIWFPHLKTDWFSKQQPALQKIPFVLTVADHGRMIVAEANSIAQSKGITSGITVADARVIEPLLQVLDDKPALALKLLASMAKWCIRYTPVTAVDAPDGLVLDVSGCAHLWGGEQTYLKDIITRLTNAGYTVRAAMAGTVGTAWALARFSNNASIIENGNEAFALQQLPPAALRLDDLLVQHLHKLGLNTIGSFTAMQRSALRRRFGQELLKKLDQTLGFEDEVIIPVQPPEPYQEWLPCFDPVGTATGIEIALKQLLEKLHHRLAKEGKGVRAASLTCYRIDGKTTQISIGTNRPSNSTVHLFKLFELKIPGIEPGLGIELFILEASKTEDVAALQETLWHGTSDLEDPEIAELLDRIEGKLGRNVVQRYLPAEHYWPERSFKIADSLSEKPDTIWRSGKQRPVHLLPQPELVQVTAPIPDYPPMHFRYRNKLHKITKADGPERIERAWWLDGGQHRDYYCVEDEDGHRYWLFRLGHYGADTPHAWFIHGFFA